jgi:hypothetical protein
MRPRIDLKQSNSSVGLVEKDLRDEVCEEDAAVSSRGPCAACKGYLQSNKGPSMVSHPRGGVAVVALMKSMVVACCECHCQDQGEELPLLSPVEQAE